MSKRMEKDIERGRKETWGTAKDGEGGVVGCVCRSRVETWGRGVPGLSARRPYGVLLAGPDEAAVSASRTGAARSIRTTQRADGAEGNLSGATGDGSTRGPCERFGSVFVPAITGASVNRGSGGPPRGRGSPRRAVRGAPSP